MHRFFSIWRKLTQGRASTPKPPPNSRRSSFIADGRDGKFLFPWRNSDSREPTPCKENVRTAEKPTTIFSRPGKTPIRISRYCAKPKLNIRNSPQPHPRLRRRQKA